MELYVLNKDMQAIHLLDTFESLLWTERYYECGDFEISSPASIELLKTFEKENYLWSKDSDTVMIIEDLEISDIEDHFRKYVNPNNMFVLPKEIGYLGEIDVFIEEQKR